MGDGRGVVVIGLGISGSAAALWLARAGVDVLGLDQFALGHVRASSHGHSRVLRRSHLAARRVHLAAEAFEAWQRLETMVDTELVTTVGGVELFPADAPVDPDLLSSALWAAGVSFDWLDGVEVARRWPAFAHGGEATAAVRAVHCADTAIVPPGRTSATLHQLAVRHGAELRPHAPVRELRPTSAGIEVVLDGDEDVEVIRADRVVLTAGAWTDRLLAPLGVSLGVVSRREQHCWLPHARVGEFTIGRLPAWTWHGDRTVHGLPVYGVTDAVKCWEDDGAEVVDPDERSHEPDAVGEERVRSFHERLLGRGAGRSRTTTWVSTAAGDGELVCGALPTEPRVLVGLPPSDGVMFAPWLGRELADLATGAAVRLLVAPAAVDRASLRPAGGPTGGTVSG